MSGTAPAPLPDASHVRRMCDIILGNAFGDAELDGLALFVGHHPDVMNTVGAPAPAPSARRIVQIAVSGQEGACDEVYALCSDGTLWSLWRVADYQWKQLPPIPQPEQEAA